MHGEGVIEARLNRSEKIRVHHTLKWLGGHGFYEHRPGYWDLIPLERLWAWIDEKPDERGWLAAMVMPKNISRTGEGAVTRELLVRYGEREPVQGNLTARFLGGSWWGNASDRYERLKREAVTWRQDETDLKVQAWLDEYIATLTRQIETWRIEEEREMP